MLGIYFSEISIKNIYYVLTVTFFKQFSASIKNRFYDLICRSNLSSQSLK